MYRFRLMTAAGTAAVFVMAGLVAPATAGAASAPSAARSPAGSQSGPSIVTRLKHLPGVTFLGSNPNSPPGYKVYELEIRQPVDHHHPHGATFEQHLELYQRNVNAPMVMFISGYFNYTFLSPQDIYLSDAATIVGGNQLSIEHRFYGDSVPHPTPWKDLTVWQEAADEHHVVQVFRTLYQAKWLVTGVSKGGETSIFHDFFYPHDFAGTFAWSAPSITDTFSGQYDHFLANVGTASCRMALLKAQTRALKHRALFETDIASEAKAAGGTFDDWKHGLDENFELSVLATPFVFWQYGGDCSTIPGQKASLDTLYKWFDLIDGWLAADDQENAPFLSYNVQAQTQLGYPILHDRAKFGSLLHYSLSAQQPEEDIAPGIPVGSLSQGLMRAVHQWVRTHGNHLFFLYGQEDPWSAQPFTLGPGTRDSAIYTIAGGNHLSPYTALPAAQLNAFVNALRTWAGLSAAAPAVRATVPTPAFVARVGG